MSGILFFNFASCEPLTAGFVVVLVIKLELVLTLVYGIGIDTSICISKKVRVFC